jgi:hypothetical protein
MEEVKANIYDESFFYMEPYSGVPLENVIQIMTSILIEKDDLFANTPQNTLVPAITLWNSGNLSESFVNS